MGIKNEIKKELRYKLKTYRKLYGKDSKQVFTVIKQLKSLTCSQEEINDWINHTLKRGSFGGRE